MAGGSAWQLFLQRFLTPRHWQLPSLEQKNSAFSLQCGQEGSVQQVAGHFDLCVTGAALAAIQNESGRVGQGVIEMIVEKTRIFARVTPDQKEFVVRVLNDRGHVTMMCGDGTNDVGALKQSHCGVGLLARDENDPEACAYPCPSVLFVV